MIRFLIIFIMSMAMLGCAKGGGSNDEYFERKRASMVSRQLKGRDITDERVLEAMSKVPRHLFVLPRDISSAYGDYPLPIGCDQTISQPYIVALMTQVLSLKGGETVLEIGTGSGYQAAILSKLCAEVYSIEIVPELAESAAEKLEELGYDNVQVLCGDGYKGWPHKSVKFDGIIVTAAPPKVPRVLLNQLKIGGRLVVPEGVAFQNLRLYTRHEDGFDRKNLIPVRFVPMIHGENR